MYYITQIQQGWQQYEVVFSFASMVSFSMENNRVEKEAFEESGEEPLQGNVVGSTYGALRFRDFRLLLCGLFLSGFGQQMQTVALGWELYNRTGSALVLGGIGLAEMIPLIVLTLPAGHVADRHSR